ncbi:MAG: HAD family hydrolase [Deltaproteobacteria bacterium]|nr:HAD family hydrolase [Deltaproteobacteria bacterium]
MSRTAARESLGFLNKLIGIIEKTKKPLVILDLDGTLFNVNHRHFEILRRFALQPKIRAEFPTQVAILEKIKDSDFHYTIESTLNAKGIDRHSERSAHFIKLVETYWFKHFFADDFVLMDRPYPGAAECVSALHQAGAHLTYLSGRDVPNMSRGTIEALEKHGFPHSGHGISVFLKPAYGQDDLLFKKQAIRTIRSEGEVVATFDNEPANVQLFAQEFPRAMNFHFNSLYARHIELKGSGVYVIRSFAELGSPE